MVQRKGFRIDVDGITVASANRTNNGAANALSGENALKAEVGETVRIYFGAGGRNKTSSFHVIGEISDSVYNLGSLTAEPLSNVQTPPKNPRPVGFRELAG